MADALIQISEGVQIDETKIAVDPTEGQHPIHELIDDRDRFRHEIHEQIGARMKKYLVRTERTKSDFVKPRVSEELAFAGQVQSHTNAELQLKAQKEAQSKAGKEDFDKDAYFKLKEEIKSRKAAKERLLNQGLPEFEAYLRF